MPSTYVKLASTTVGAGGAASIDFTSIPQTYTDLVVKVSSRGTNADVFSGAIVRFNSDTGNNYTYRALQGTGAAAASFSATSTSSFVSNTSGASSTSNTFGNLEFYIPNYTGSSQKSITSDGVSENNATTSYTNLVSGVWANTSAITSISVINNNGNWAQYSTATLYGVLKYAETGTGSKAIGGTVTTSGGYTYHTFFSSGMFTPTASITGAEILVVAGGGAGGGNKGGGGGAGGVSYLSGASLTSGTPYNVIIGAGGRTGVDGTTYNAGFGTNSVFNNIISNGGGYGGNDNNAAATQNGGTGGSGGGASRAGSVGGTNQGSTGGATGYGFAGGLGINTGPYGGGGGGGAGQAGQAAVGGSTGYGGAGGNGLNTWSTWLSATGTGVNGYIAGGGGGGLYDSTASVNGGAGGFGGGGSGGNNVGGTEIIRPAAGFANTGGGGGGAGNQGGTTGVGGGASGGSGLVIVRYTT